MNSGIRGRGHESEGAWWRKPSAMRTALLQPLRAVHTPPPEPVVYWWPYQETVGGLILG